jgi:hypothetical protein
VLEQLQKIGGINMSNIINTEDILFEHQFWLQILGDHARFIHDSLSPDEEEKIARSSYFIQTFDKLLAQARKPLSNAHVSELTKIALAKAQEFRGFKLELIKEHIAGTIKISLPPTFINHMVNEIEEYLRIMLNILEGQSPDASPLHYHNLWLPDAAGHAGAIQCRLDDVESGLRMRSKDFVNGFHDLHMKAEEFVGYTRTNLQEFPALSRLNHQAESLIEMFMRFLKEIEDQIIDKSVLGTLLPLMTDHMFREECYYIYSLSKVSEVKNPDCNPAKPRLQD